MKALARSLMIPKDHLEQLSLRWFQDSGSAYLTGPDIAPEAVGSGRAECGAVVFKVRLVAAVARLNLKLPAAAVEEVADIATKAAHPSLIQRKRAFHRMLTDGVKIEYTNADGRKEADFAYLIDRIFASIRKSCAFAVFRDTLLLRLLSGDSRTLDAATLARSAT